MALLKAVALGAVAAMSVPYVLRDAGGALGTAARYGTVTPAPGVAGVHFSLPVFLFVALLGWLLLRAAER